MMKSILITFITLTTALNSFSQQVDLRKKIDITGLAEQEITPDEIYMGISLKEYFTDNSNKKKVSIAELEKQLQGAVTKAGIAQEDFMINNVSSYNYVLEKKKNPGFLARKQYRLKVSDLNKFNSIINAIDAKGIESTNVDSYSHSKLDVFKNDLKLKALKNAKEKAKFMVEGIGEQLGGVLDIQEVNNEYFPQPMMYKREMMAMSDAAAPAPEPEIDFKKIKISCQVKAVFEIR